MKRQCLCSQGMQGPDRGYKDYTMWKVSVCPGCCHERGEQLNDGGKEDILEEVASKT